MNFMTLIVETVILRSFFKTKNNQFFWNNWNKIKVK